MTLPYVEQGDPTGTPVVFLHGVTDSWRSWQLVLPELPDAIHAFVLTQRGHGDAERPSRGYSQDGLAADVAAFMDAVGLGAAIIVGTSLGSTVAQHFALAYPERVLGLVLAGTFSGYRNNPAVVEFAEFLATLTDPITPDFAREFQESTLAQPIPQSFLDTVVAESLKVPARVWQAVFDGCVMAEWEDRLGEITAPTLIVWGDQDVYAPRADQETLVAAIAGARLEVYVGAGHAMHWEEPDRFAADLVDFVERLG